MDFSKTFTDAAGRTWTVELTVGSARRMKDLAGVTLDELVPSAETAKKTDGAAMQPLATFLADPFRVFDAFYSLVKPQADTLGLTKEQVEDGIDSAAAEAMGLAILRGIHDFFRADPTRQALLRRVVKLMPKAMEAVGQKIDQELDKIDTGAILRQTLDALPGLNADGSVAPPADPSSKPATATPATSA